MTPGEGRAVALSWIVVCHESRRDLGVLLPSLVGALEDLAREGLSSELIVVDSGSSDDPAEVVARLAPGARFVSCGGNVGYGAAANRGARLATGRWLAVGNADLYIPRGGLGRLAEVLGAVDDDVALVGPALYGSDGRRCLSAGRFPSLATLLKGLLRPCHRRKYLHERGHRAGDVDWVTGACLFARADVFAAAGGFDRDFFLYYEDVDLARRLARTGRRTVYAPAVSITHVRPHHGRPPQANIEEIVRASRSAYFARHRPAWERWLLARLTRLEPVVRRRSRRRAEAPASLPPVPVMTSTRVSSSLGEAVGRGTLPEPLVERRAS